MSHGYLSKNYLLLKAGVPRQLAEKVETVMLECGALSCTLQDAADNPIHEPAPGTAPLWPDVIVTGFFSGEADRDILTHLVASEIRHFTDAELSSELLEDKDWERAWMDDFKPVEVTPALWIVPTFCEPPDIAATNISIDPGLAFGSGTHPTTHLCLQWLAGEDLDGKTVIDYGCGSGILAIAAALLGAEQIFAFDIEPQALLATKDNASRNRVENKITICHSDSEIPANVDMVVANILFGPLMELRSRFHELLADAGKLCVSGVLSDQVGALDMAYSEQFRHAETGIREQWSRYTAVKAS